MKVAIPLLLAVAVLAFGGLYFWKQQQISGAEGEVTDLQQISEARAMVPVTFVVKPPADTTPQDQALFISGSHPAIGSWEAAGLILEPQPDGTHKGTCEMLSGIEQEFKVTRGSWNTVEYGADDEEVENRVFTVDGEGQEIVVEVAAWVDDGQTEPGRMTTTGTVQVYERRFQSTVDATKPRSVVVYLPPNYDADADRTFPVLYVNDGQNLFNEADTFAGVEWGLDETAQSKIGAGEIKPVVIVGLYNTEDRDVEYDAGVEAYATHLVETIMPFINERYRVSQDRADTTIAGAALGGRAALEVARLQPDTFGAVVALSPWVVDEEGNAIADTWAANADATADWAGKTRFYLDTVPATDYYATQTPVEDLAAIASWLEGHNADVTHGVVEGGEHREASWGQRAADALEWLLGS